MAYTNPFSYIKNTLSNNLNYQPKKKTIPAPKTSVTPSLNYSPYNPPQSSSFIGPTKPAVSGVTGGLAVPIGQSAAQSAAQVGMPAVPTGGVAGAPTYAKPASKPPVPPVMPQIAPPQAPSTISEPPQPPQAPQTTSAPAMPQVSPEATKTMETAEKAYQSSMQLSPNELSTQEEIDKLIESAKSGYRAASGQAIPMEFITGQLKAIEQRATGLAEPLERKLARMQAARQVSTEASKFALERAEKKMTEEKKVGEPQTVAPGTSVVKFNPTTGKYESMYTAPKEAVKPASAQEYEYAVSQGYKGTFNQYQNEDANRKARAGGAGTATDDAAVASWVGLIKGGQAKITSVPAALKNAVAQAMGETPASSSGRNLVDDTISAITTLETTPGKTGAIGTNLLFGFGKNIPGSESAGYLTQLDRVKSLLTLPNLQYMKGLGAMSDREFNTIASSVAALNPNMREQQFDAELARIKSVMTETSKKLQAGATTGAGATEPPAQMKLPNGTVVTRQADGTYK